MEDTQLNTIDEVAEDLRSGKMVVLVDDEDRENEGDLVCAAEHITPEIVNFMVTWGRGLICVPLEAERCEKLGLHPQSLVNTASLGTAFTVSVDAKDGITTGVSASDRSKTIQVLSDDKTKPYDLARPGHIFPLRAKEGGVLTREGQTEGAVDLARIAGLKPAGVICEIMNDDGSMKRFPDLVKFCREHDLKMTSVANIIEYRMQKETQVRRMQAVSMPTDFGEFELVGYESLGSTEPHIALCKGDLTTDEPVLIRMHSECMTGDLFHSKRCECGKQMEKALEMIQREGRGVFVYLRQEGRGIGLVNKLKAYKLQEDGLDTYDANVELGFAPDKRDYGIGAQILRDLGVSKVKILTNNPKKIERLKVYGIEVVEQMPIEMQPCEYNVNYLRTKKHRFGHLLKGEDL
ncbi:bifunctional 3,4-dihydroxy-2-butanone-4-phosphate synthase/GTP cyclohydrolase II [Sedimentisphaera salicampi]|uniref:bifunctional 3,4-dihydroxy-2-butanone-4-phosphate synthase/GTP cyclohydrolase II n=1 Tax=Sedimentisphaera salicampi TaxID=1941349 RepID=UPI000B9B18DE|nr:bifunctional 3,4-dihydroxy-2-butanone-4-phosphate synthase/GTP cyclohydrolase II [Sedimentisphaera salicampi]OXU15789.1 Riboflavin biosynthesis protein RibBA [Sedimentisphaera salicampi]